MIIKILTCTFLSIYLLSSFALMVYGMHCYVMLYLFLRRQRKARADIARQVEAYNQGREQKDYPPVTIQLPVYNEAEVVERMIRSASQVNYPLDRLQIQVIDDSNDETCAIIDRLVAELRQTGLNISTVRRDERHHFKAGALANAMRYSTGKYLAIFDADFIIPKNFLVETVPLIDTDPSVACVQGRWSHINRNENWLTRAQSVGINGHFAAEQGARSYNNLCMNFNGTAGLWRATAIEDAGGWQGDTLTEDLDLSYRVQLAGWRIVYHFDLDCPSEIPNNVAALKSQQRRWAKGSIETAIKLIPTILKSTRLGIMEKIEAVLHLTHYLVAPLMLTLSACTLPVLILVSQVSYSPLVALVWAAIIISAVAPCVMYTGSGCVLKQGLFSLAHFPYMLVVGTGLCLNNSIAVCEALLRYKTPFIRTPKSGSDQHRSVWGRYRLLADVRIATIEILFGIYCLYSLFYYINSGKFLFGFFIGAYAAGFLTFGLYSLRRGRTTS